MTDTVSPALPQMAGIPVRAGEAAAQGVGMDALLAEYYLAEWREQRQANAQRQAGLRENTFEALARRRLEDRRLEEQALYVRAQQELVRQRPNYNDAEQLRERVDQLARTL